MLRFLMSASVAVVGLALLTVSPAPAASSGGHSHKGVARSQQRHGHGSGHHFKANRRFAYGKYGFRSLSWSRYRWSKDYGCYVYWAPRLRSWCFYEPTFRYYVPVSNYREVYPEAPAVEAAPVIKTPSVVQQTTVVVTLPPAVAPVAPPAPVLEGPPEAPIAPAAPAPKVIQNTKVGSR
jgi:hypothetical protein